MDEPIWKLEAPGVLRLAGTKVTVEQAAIGGPFDVCLDRRPRMAAGNLAAAQQVALDLVRDALAMGHEP